MKLQCLKCVHYERKGTCAAFPEMIPEDVFSGGIEHDKILANQVGTIRFEASKKVKKVWRREELYYQQLSSKYKENKEEFKDLILNQLQEEGLYDTNWDTVIIDMEAKKGHSWMSCSLYEYYLLTGKTKIALKREIDRLGEREYYASVGQKFKRLRRQLWTTVYFQSNKTSNRFRFKLSKDETFTIEPI